MRPMSEQEIWNEQIANIQLKLASKSKFKKLLNEVTQPESEHPQSVSHKSDDVISYDPIANAMKRFPGLTREEAEEIAEAFGF